MNRSSEVERQEDDEREMDGEKEGVGKAGHGEFSGTVGTVWVLRVISGKRRWCLSVHEGARRRSSDI